MRVYFCVCEFSYGNFEWYNLFIDSLIRGIAQILSFSHYYYTFAPYPEPHYLYLYSYILLCLGSGSFTVTIFGFYYSILWIATNDFSRVLLQPGYERLCCLRCIQTRDHNFATTCVCRVPKHLREEKVIECVHCGCRGCDSCD